MKMTLESSFNHTMGDGRIMDLDVYLFNRTNLTGLKDFFGKGYEQPWESAIIAVFSILILLGVLGNSLVCLIVLKRPKMRTPRNIFIINLAVSDLTLCLFTQPFNLVRLLHIRWNLGEVLCKLVPACSATNFYVSTISITAIALDRFQVIVYPTRDPMKTGKVVCLSLLLIWMASICMALPIVFFYKLKPIILWGFYLHEVCVENKDLHSTRKMYSVVSMTLLYLTPILAVSVSHLLISRKLKNRMINRQFNKDKNSHSSSKFLSKPKSGIEPPDSSMRHVSSSSFVLTTAVSGATEAGTSFGRMKNESQANIEKDGPIGPGMNWIASTLSDDKQVNAGQERQPIDIESEIVTNTDDNKVGFSRNKSPATVSDSREVTGSQDNSGQRQIGSLDEVEVTETSKKNSNPSSPLPGASSGASGILSPFKGRKKSDASAVSRQETRIPKLKPSLRREQRLQSHRQQLAQLGSQLQQLNQLQRQQPQPTSPTSQKPSQIQSTRSVQIPLIVETLAENSTHDNDPNLSCLSELNSPMDDSNRIENAKATSSRRSRKGQRSASSFSMSSFKNKFRRSSKRIPRASETRGGQQGAKVVTNERVTAEEILSPLERQKKSREEASKRKRKTNRLLLTIALVFAISWLPMNLFNLLSDFQSDFIHSLNRRSKQLLAPICLIMVLVSACVNPLLYGWLNENFRQEFQQILCCCKTPADRGRIVKGSVKGRPG